MARASRTRLSGHLRRHRHYSKPFIFIPRGREKGTQTARETKEVSLMSKTKIPTAADVLKRQREEHGVIVPANKALPAVNGGGASAYLAEHGVGMSGTFLKFNKDGKFVKTIDDEEIPAGTELACIYDQTQAGFIKFTGKGNPPERRMGPIFDGFMPPPREELGDTDESQWERDLSGKPADPWQHQMLLPLQSVETDELFIFATSSITGRRAVGNLLSQCERMRLKEPDAYPVIKLRTGGFQHRDERVGYVKTPAFDVVGRAPKGNLAAATTAIADDMSDAIPF
jgi:hypothetical protein